MSASKSSSPAYAARDSNKTKENPRARKKKKFLHQIVGKSIGHFLREQMMGKGPAHQPVMPPLGLEGPEV